MLKILYVNNRMIVFTIFCVFTVFFWAAFEQGAGSLPLYTRDFTDRFLEGNAALIFKIVDISVTVIPLLIITYVLISLFKKTYSQIPLSNIILSISFVIIIILRRLRYTCTLLHTLLY